ncbi:hypothetical protein BDN72DRAFT_857995 [Pluteus cervinus]|uniref:Uncharacterized protein n=1 Tax=Pluteus cervinus TaxID=181527 RepID=A0ACD3AUF7_9AGAR|nr:hypothetical protein BDN72DRAFT_857995 [Pluteus cervinus]
MTLITDPTLNSLLASIGIAPVLYLWHELRARGRDHGAAGGTPPKVALFLECMSAWMTMYIHTGRFFCFLSVPTLDCVGVDPVQVDEVDGRQDGTGQPKCCIDRYHMNNEFDPHDRRWYPTWVCFDNCNRAWAEWNCGQLWEYGRLWSLWTDGSNLGLKLRDTIMGLGFLMAGDFGIWRYDSESIMWGSAGVLYEKNVVDGQGKGECFWVDVRVGEVWMKGNGLGGLIGVYEEERKRLGICSEAEVNL